MFFDKPAPQMDMQAKVDWYEHQARIAQEIRKARERTLAVVRKEAGEITVGAQVLCDAELPDSWRPRSDTVLTP